MKVFVRTVLLSGLGLGCLALGSGAQTPPPAPPVLPTAPTPPAPGGGATVIQGVPGAHGMGTFMRAGDRTWTVTIAEDGKAVELARKMVSAKGEDKEKLQKQLREVLDKAFDDRQKRHEKEIEALEAQVKKLKSMVAKRKENREDIIDERMKQLERDANGLGW